MRELIYDLKQIRSDLKDNFSTAGDLQYPMLTTEQINAIEKAALNRQEAKEESISIHPMAMLALVGYFRIGMESSNRLREVIHGFEQAAKAGASGGLESA